jgi:hypothetical protein
MEKVAEGMPKKKQIDWRAGRTISPEGVNYQAGFNEGLKLCQAYWASRVGEIR